jgi:hypothetical protein
MKRFLLLLTNELKLFRTSIPIHLVAVLQPTVMYLLMSLILVHPTFDVYMTRPTTVEGQKLAAAMGEVGSPIGMPYIALHYVEGIEPSQDERQVIRTEERQGRPTAVQRFGLVDSNMVKNYRNRLTAAVLRVWNADLGNKAVTIDEHPWLLKDVSYLVYFGMAMLPFSAAVGPSILGGILTAQEFEAGTILEARLAPVRMGMILGARIVRLTLFGLLGTGVALLAVGWPNHYWPESLGMVALTLLPVAIIYGCVGVIAGLHFQKTIPSFLVGLVVSMVCWLLGSAFGLSGGFSVGYETLSRLTPNTHAVELLFPHYFGATVGQPWISGIALSLMSLGMIALTGLIYRVRVFRQE